MRRNDSALILIAIILLSILCLFWYTDRQPPVVTPTPTSTNTQRPTATVTQTPLPTFKATSTKVATFTPTATSRPTLRPTFTATMVPPVVPTVTATKDYRWWNCMTQTWMDYPRARWQSCK